LWVALYIYFIGLSAGSFLLSTLVFVFGNKLLEPIGRLAVLQALVCLLAGMAFIFIDLGHWERFWHVFVYPQWNSVLAWEIWLYCSYVVVLVGELWLLMRCDLARWRDRASRWARGLYRVLCLGFECPSTREAEAACQAQAARWLKWVGIAGIPVALGVHGGTGAIFAVVKAHPVWCSPIFPVVFIVSALASGGGLPLFLSALVLPRAVRQRQLLEELARLTIGFLVVDLILLGLEFLTGFYGGIPDHVEPYRLIAFGPFWWVFWIVQLGIGAVVPLLLMSVARHRIGTVRLGLMGLCVVVGIFGVRLNIVIPALAVPAFRGYDQAIASARLASLYVPNWVEWLSSWSIIGFMALLFYAGLRFLPVVEHQPYLRRSHEVGYASGR